MSSNFNNCSYELLIIFHQVNITLTIFLFFVFCFLPIVATIFISKVFDVVIFQDKESSGGVNGM